MPGASGSENVQNTVEQSAGVTPRAANVRLRWGEVFLDNSPEIIVNFPENHDPRFYLRCLIILGSPAVLHNPYDDFPPARASILL